MPGSRRWQEAGRGRQPANNCCKLKVDRKTRDEEKRRQWREGGRGGGVMGYLQSLVGTARSTGTVLQSGHRFPWRRRRRGEGEVGGGGEVGEVE